MNLIFLIVIFDQHCYGCYFSVNMLISLGYIKLSLISKLNP